MAVTLQHMHAITLCRDWRNPGWPRTPPTSWPTTASC